MNAQYLVQTSTRANYDKCSRCCRALGWTWPPQTGHRACIGRCRPRRLAGVCAGSADRRRRGRRAGSRGAFHSAANALRTTEERHAFARAERPGRAPRAHPGDGGRGVWRSAEGPSLAARAKWCPWKPNSAHLARHRGGRQARRGRARDGSRTGSSNRCASGGWPWAASRDRWRRFAHIRWSMEQSWRPCASIRRPHMSHSRCSNSLSTWTRIGSALMRSGHCHRPARTMTAQRLLALSIAPHDSATCRRYGNEWAASRRSAALVVPSMLVSPRLEPAAIGDPGTERIAQPAPRVGRHVADRRNFIPRRCPAKTHRMNAAGGNANGKRRRIGSARGPWHRRRRRASHSAT